MRKKLSWQGRKVVYVLTCFVGIQNLLRLDFEQKSVIRG